MDRGGTPPSIGRFLHGRKQTKSFVLHAVPRVKPVQQYGCTADYQSVCVFHTNWGCHFHKKLTHQIVCDSSSGSVSGSRWRSCVGHFSVGLAVRMRFQENQPTLCRSWLTLWLRDCRLRRETSFGAVGNTAFLKYRQTSFRDRICAQGASISRQIPSSQLQQCFRARECTAAACVGVSLRGMFRPPFIKDLDNKKAPTEKSGSSYQ